MAKHFLKDYQEWVKGISVYPIVDKMSWVYPALGLSNEAGEVLGILKKVLRDSNSQITPEIHDKLKSEISDCCWYLAALCNELHLDLKQVIEYNRAKLEDRKARGVLKGSGDNR